MTTMIDAAAIFPDQDTAALAEAAAAGDAATVARLAKQGVALDARGDKNVTLLEWALLNQSRAGLEALLEAGADPSWPGIDDSTVVHMAAMAEDPCYLQLLLEKGADADTPHGRTRATPLAAALMGERARQFQALLAAGADPGRADRMGNTPLHVAAKINEPARVLDLLRAGADPGGNNAQGVTFQRYLFLVRDALLNPTTRRDRAMVVEWLREHGAVVETQAAH